MAIVLREAGEIVPYVDSQEVAHPGIVRINTPAYADLRHSALRNKLVARRNVSKLGKMLRFFNHEVVFTPGTYDMIHCGHARYLELARSLGTVLVVGINSDRSVREYKGPDRPILAELRRAEMLAHLEAVGHVVIFNEDYPNDVIRQLRPHKYLCIEEDEYVGRLQDRGDVQTVLSIGGLVYCAPRQDPELSTSKIVAKLVADGRRNLARELSDSLNRETAHTGSL